MKPLSLELVGTLSRLPLFQELDSTQLQSIALNARELSIAKGEMIFQRGDRAKGFYLLLKGQIKLAFPSFQGNEKVIAIVGPGQAFGEAAMFLDQPYLVRAEALVNASLLLIGANAIFDLLAQDAQFARRLLAGLSLRLHQLVQDVELYSQRSSSQRVIGYLLQLCQSLADGNHPVTIDLPTTKQVVASRLNLTPETLSRILHDLSQQGLIEMSGRRIQIPQPELLRAYEL